MDNVQIEVLPDGSLKMTTDKISAPNHGNCETMLREIAMMAGGKVKTQRKPGVPKTHTHGNVTHTHN